MVWATFAVFWHGHWTCSAQLAFGVTAEGKYEKHILAKDKPEFNNPQVLQKVVRTDSRPYVRSADELSKINVKEISLNDGVGFYANFVDPDLAGKPIKKGDYKTATPVILSLGKKYLIKVTILCDKIDGPDYGDAIRIVRSLNIKAR